MRGTENVGERGGGEERVASDVTWVNGSGTRVEIGQE